MLRKFRLLPLLLLSLLFLFGGFVFFGLGPLLDWRLNGVYPNGAGPVTGADPGLHESLFVADLHADTLCWDRDLYRRNSRGHLDLPRIADANLALQVLTVFTQIPRGQNIERNAGDSDVMPLLAVSARWPLRTFFRPAERALYLARRAHSLAAESGGALRIVVDGADLASVVEARRQGERVTGVVLGLEGGHALENGLADLDRMYNAGYRLIGFVHFFDNVFGGSAHGVQKGGLSSEGRRLLHAMEARAMIVDLAHASPALIDATLREAERPVLVSHTGLKSVCPSNRNLDDDQVRAIAAKQGLIGIGFWAGATCGRDMAATVRSIVRATRLVGAAHVALGSDFDGAATMPFDVTALPRLTRALLEAGLSASDVRLIMGENIRRFFMRALPERTPRS
jgi:microsomal dipeptidase-like Zn-dependent dipeptidase